MKKINEEKINVIITWLIRGLLLIAVLTSIIQKNYDNVFIAIIAIAGTFLPNIIERKMKVSLPISLQIIIVILIYLAGGLGEIQKFYYTVPWWDDMIHMTSGGVLAIIGIIFVYLLNKNNPKKVQLSPFFVVLFAFCFAIMVDVIWEIYEFSMDRIIGTDMQKFRLPGSDGLIDTMNDLITDIIGDFIVCLVSYKLLKGKPKIKKKIEEKLINNKRTP